MDDSRSSRFDWGSDRAHIPRRFLRGATPPEPSLSHQESETLFMVADVGLKQLVTRSCLVLPQISTHDNAKTFHLGIPFFVIISLDQPVGH